MVPFAVCCIDPADAGCCFMTMTLSLYETEKGFPTNLYLQVNLR